MFSSPGASPRPSACSQQSSICTCHETFHEYLSPKRPCLVRSRDKCATRPGLFAHRDLTFNKLTSSLPTEIGRLTGMTEMCAPPVQLHAVPLWSRQRSCLASRRG